MDFNELLNRFGLEIELEGFEPDQEGVYQLNVDDVLLIEFSPKGLGEIVISTVIGNVPEDAEDGSELLERLLKTNLGRMKEQDNTLSVDPQTSEIILYRQAVLSDLTVERFVDVVEEFVNDAEGWQVAAHESVQRAPHFQGLFP